MQNRSRGVSAFVSFLTGRKQAWGFYEKLGYQAISDDYEEGKLVMRIYKKKIRSSLEQTEKRR